MTRPPGIARGPGLIAMGAVLLGGALVLVSIGFLDWYDFRSGADTVDRVSFRDLAFTADHVDVPGVVPAYFDWLVWVLLIGVVLVATLAFVRPRAAVPLRVTGFILGALGAFLTWYALQQITSYGRDGSYAFRSATVGVWLTLAGFGLAGIGAAIGPRRV